MDEPTSALVKKDIDILFDTILTLKKRGVSVIYISHRLEEIAVIGDRITVLRDGAYVGTVPARDTDINTLVRMIVGRRLEDKYPKHDTMTGNVRLSVRGLNKKGVLKDINLDAKGGEILGIAGLVGSGRTELAKALFGAEPADEGSIKVDGAEALVRSPKEAIDHGIGLIPEDRKIDGLVDILSVRENLTLPIIQRIRRLFLIDRARQSALCNEFVGQLQIKTPSISRAVRYLSGGNQQKVVVAKWMLTESKVLIFDEPTRGIDVGAKVEIYRLMNTLAARGTSIIMISSEMPEVLGMSDRILVMRQGEIVGEFSRDEADQERIMRCALSA
jgi:ribose transport system ATP-binding protein